MGLPPPQFYSFHPWVNYITVHLVLTAFFNFYPNLLVPKIYDTLLFPLDGLLRAHSVVSAVSLFASPSISNPLSALSQPSPFKNMDTAFGHIVLGILASAAGGITLNTLSLWSEEWRFATPPILKASLWGSADVWGGALAAIVYSSSIHSSAFQIPSLDSLTAAHFPLTVIPKFILRIFFKPSVGGFGAGLNQVSRFSIPFIYSLFGLANTKTSFVEADSEKPPTQQTTAVPMGQVEAKALAAIILITIFGARVLATHWLTSPPKAGRGNKSKKAVTEVSKEAKRK
ncbi:hypothetical protein CC2G_013006 [Coprinopsis cinerea AmutBmut pab1-1]|nr:hypothetical protein CC2G_004936 [Coprinopsis cinerea AmutBmut pab1-1]KAG2010163.1 hypothetical protein CC2G_013006 [Coprinopsis cinerea AmutBmut pab1-1]